MDWVENSLVVFFGMGIRLAVPVLITSVLVMWLRKMDARWQVEAQQANAAKPDLSVQVLNRGCWEIKGCPTEKMQSCQAYLHQETPCWQVFRAETGQLKQACLSCNVLMEAPIPN